MPAVTLDIPADRYVRFLRLAADFLAETDFSTAPGEISLSDDGEPRPWRFSTLDPDTDNDFRLLVEYLGKLKGYAVSVLDYLVDQAGSVDGDTLAQWLLLDSRRAVAGSLGHAARFATDLGRRFPIDWDRESGQYSLDEDMREAIAQARIWTVPSPYIHVFEWGGLQLSLQTDVPARFAVFSETFDEENPMSGFEGLFYDRNAVHSFDPNVFDPDLEFTLIEYTPDSARREVLVPVELHDNLGLRSERSHDLATFPQDDIVTTAEVRR